MASQHNATHLLAPFESEYFRDEHVLVTSRRFVGPRTCRSLRGATGARLSLHQPGRAPEALLALPCVAALATQHWIASFLLLAVLASCYVTRWPIYRACLCFDDGATVLFECADRHYVATVVRALQAAIVDDSALTPAGVRARASFHTVQQGRFA